MTMTLNLDPEKEARLRQKAQIEGLALEEFALETLIHVADEPTLAEALEGLIGVVDSSKYNGGQTSYSAEKSGEVFGEIIQEKHRAGHL